MPVEVKALWDYVVPGETQLEMDRRIILNRMSLLKERLAEIDKQKSTQRKNRGRMIRVALVGILMWENLL